MLNESKYYNKNGIMSSTASTPTSSSSSTSSQNSASNNLSSLRSNLNNHNHFNLHTFNQYNQPNKPIVNLNRNFNNISINRDFLNSNSSKMNNIQNAKKNNYSNTSSSSTSSSSTSSTGSANVKFTGFFKDNKVDEREKYLTAKYPNHQMALIKKRLKVEFWIDEQLKLLFDVSDENSKEDYDICPDDLVDSLLDVDSDSERKSIILKQLTRAKRPKEDILNFVDELLKRLRLL